MKDNNTITSLVLGDNQTTNVGVQTFTNWLSHNAVLNRLEMDLSSGVGDVPVLAHNYSVQDLEGSCADLVRANKKYLHRNRALIPSNDRKTGVWVLTHVLGKPMLTPRGEETETGEARAEVARVRVIEKTEYTAGHERSVIFSGVPFTEVPLLLKYISHIKKLVLWDCGITTLPIVLSHFHNLHFLDLGYNFIPPPSPPPTTTSLS